MWEVGVALGNETGIKLWFLTLERLGAGVRFGEDAGAIRFYTSSLFF
jgi:hypothetical protein